MTKHPNFRVGDRVRLVDSRNLKLRRGAEGTVVAVGTPPANSRWASKSIQVSVRFDNPSVGVQDYVYEYQLEKIAAAG